MCVCVRLSVRHRILNHFCCLLPQYLHSGKGFAGFCSRCECGLPCCAYRTRVLGQEATDRRLHLHARMCIHIAAASSSALSHSVVLLVTEMHVDERTGMCLLLLLKSLCLHGRRHSAVASLRACAFVCQAMRSVQWPQCGDCGRRASTCRRRALPDLSPASSSPRSYLWVTRPSPRCWKGGVGVSADLGGRPFS